ncbi:MAG: BON domain-containing protein [Alphaproteobacteria bacterium]|jgi:osmotically-inducible protein OsmY|nr:BON domain-containing protein [Alphaproteobacteria bacterium]
MNDTIIREYVFEKLNFEQGLRAQNIMISVENGIVTLSGRVRTYCEKYLAEQATKNVRGVKAVVEELVVDVDAPLQRSDKEIAAAVVQALEADVSLMPPEKIKVVVENGKVELTGEVDEFYKKQQAFECVKNLYGVTNVFNYVVVNSAAKAIDPKNVTHQIVREFQRNAVLDAKSIEVAIDGSKVILRGIVRSWAEEKEARKAAWSVPGVTEVKDELVLHIC